MPVSEEIKFLEILNSLGEKERNISYTTMSQGALLNVEQLAPGFYFISVAALSGNIFRQKFIKD